MKKLLSLIALCGALTVTQTILAQPILVGVYNSVSNQLFIVSNTPSVDAKLAKSLNGVLSTIQKAGGGTNLASGIKALGSVVSVVNRTTVSNAVQSSLQGAVLTCVSQYVTAANTYSNQLVTLFPSTARTGAYNAISNLQVTLLNISSNVNLAVAVKSLSGLTKQVATIQKGVTSAQKAPSPTASLTATILISGSPSFNFVASQAVLQHNFGGNFTLNSAETTGSGLGTTLHSLAFGIYGLVSGPNTVSGSDGEYSRTTLSAGAGAFSITTSSLQLNWDDAHKLVSGTFTLGLLEQGGSRTGSVTGSFTLYYQ